MRTVRRASGHARAFRGLQALRNSKPGNTRAGKGRPVAYPCRASGIPGLVARCACRWIARSRARATDSGQECCLVSSRSHPAHCGRSGDRCGLCETLRTAGGARQARQLITGGLDIPRSYGGHSWPIAGGY